MHYQKCPICGVEFKVNGKQKRTYCTRKCMSEGYKDSLRGENNPNYRHGPKHCEKCGEEIHRHSKQWCMNCVPKSGRDNPFFGKKHSKETCEKLSKIRKGKNYWKGRKHTQDSKDKMSKYRKDKWQKMSNEEKKTHLAILRNLLQKQLSNKSMTRPEKIVQIFLQSKNISHKYSHSMYDKFFVDFWLPQNNTIIEVFGDYWHGNLDVFDILSDSQKRQKKKDKSRVAYLTKCGHSVIVMWEKDLKNGMVGELWDLNQENC